jgi:hypothetical protein
MQKILKTYSINSVYELLGTLVKLLLCRVISPSEDVISPIKP